MTLVDELHGRLVVSCQAYGSEPLNTTAAMLAMAQSVASGGAAGIRAQGLETIRAIDQSLSLPLIGLVKVPGHEVFITPTLQDALDVVAAGADIVALDGTRRERPDGLSLAEVIEAVHERTPALVMADASCLEDGLAAQEAGADLVSTTLAGYTPSRTKTDGPDLELVASLARHLTVPIAAEGRFRWPEETARAIELGAHCAIVGTSITHPASITARFIAAMPAPTRSPAAT